MMDLPGHLFSLDTQKDILTHVLVTSMLVEDFEALAEVAGGLAKEHLDGTDKKLDNHEAWLATLIRVALLDPGPFIRPADGIRVPLRERTLVDEKILKDYRNGKLQWVPPPLASILADQNINPPWPLRFTIASATKASAELCRRLAGNRGGKTPKGTAETPPSEFVFRRDGDGWFIRAFGKEGHFKDRKGFAYLAVLIERAGKPVPIVELIERVEGSPLKKECWQSVKGTFQQILDDQALQDILRRVKELDEAIEDATRRQDITEAEVFRRERDWLLEQYSATRARNGKSRNFPTLTNKMSSAISQALRRARDTLREAGMDELADHLKAFSKANEDSYIYSPSPDIPWVLD